MRKVFVLIGLLAGGFFAYELFLNVTFFYTPNSNDPSYKILLIEPGPFVKTADFLAKEGLVRDPKRFTLIARFLRKGNSVRVGEYEVRMDMSPSELLTVISSGKSVLHAVSIPEGYSIDQIADELAAKDLIKKVDFIKLAHDPLMAKFLGVNEKSLEGYLFPDTYSFTHFTGERIILKTMVDRFKEVYNRDIKFAAEKINISMHDIVTLASIIEKETGDPKERPLISSVFHNRLRKGMPLQTDPTVLYGKKGDKNNISKEDLKKWTPYNTYIIKGLPPGPISSPGRDSLIAAIEPAQTDYLYFVSKNNGTSYFSVTLAEHNRAVQRLQKDWKARQNHSWRELSKQLEEERKKTTPPTPLAPGGNVPMESTKTIKSSSGFN